MEHADLAVAELHEEHGGARVADRLLHNGRQVGRGDKLQKASMKLASHPGPVKRSSDADLVQVLDTSGFGVQTDDLARAALMRGEIEPQKASEVLVFGEDGYELAAVNLVRELSQKGVKSENSLCESRDEALKYAKERGIKKLFVISRDGVSEEEL